MKTKNIIFLAFLVLLAGVASCTKDQDVPTGTVFNEGLGGGNSADNYTINVSSSPSDDGTVTGSGIYQVGHSCTVTAIANEGYAFISWTENGSQVSSNASYTFTVTSNRSLVANFTVCDYSKIILNEINGNDKFIEIYNAGSVSINLNGVYIEKDGYQNWLADNTVSIEVGGYLVLYSEDVALDHPEVAESLIFHSGLSAKKNFHIQLFTPSGVSIGDFNLVNIDANDPAYIPAPASYSRNADGNWYYADATPGTVNVEGTVPVLGLEGGDIPGPSVYSVSVSANPSNGGTVSGGNTYQQGHTCTVKATSNEGYTFINWTENDDVVSTNDSFTFNVNNNRVLVANFVAVNPPTPGGEVQSLPYSQSFATTFGTYTTYSVLGLQFWEIDYQTAKISGYVVGSYYANEDWLISSPVAISDVSDANMTISYIGRYFNSINEEVTIWASADYTWGSNPTTATWTQVPATLSEGSSWSDFHTTEISLTDYVGQTITFAVKQWKSRVSP